MPISTIVPAPHPQEVGHGLLAAAEIITLPPDEGSETPSDRWEQGFTFTPESCDQPESWAIPCNGPLVPPGAAITENRGSDAPVTWYPYMIRSSFKCDAQQARSEDFAGRAKRIFMAGRSKLIESELWRGDAAGQPAGNTNMSLAGTGANAGPNYVNLGTGGVEADALAIRTLIQGAALYGFGQRAMIHATPDVAMAWWQSNALYQRGGVLYTQIGDHIVVAGQGYDGTAPGLVDPGGSGQQAYVTGPVKILLGNQIEVLGQQAAEGVDRGSNDWEVIVQQTAVAYWDGCLHAGVAVDAMGTAG